jgi:hypothetical protein
LEKAVFTHTQFSSPKSHIFRLAFCGRTAKNVFYEWVNTSKRFWLMRSHDGEISRDYPMQNISLQGFSRISSTIF